MNVLLMSLLYPDDQLAEVTHKAKDKLQNQINSYQRAFEAGIRENLKQGEKLDILNCLPVGIFPLQYREEDYMSFLRYVLPCRILFHSR